MSVEQYSLVANDWLNLEFIINDLTQRVVGQEVHPTSEPTFSAGTITNNLGVGGDLSVTGDFDIDGSLTLTGLTASRIVATNASKVLVSLASPLIVAEGGTGAATLTDHGILLGSGTGAVTPLGAAANGYIPIGSTGADPVLALIAGTTNQITSTPGAGSITLSLPNPIAIPGKLTAGSFGSPLDVTDTRQYGVELHYSGNNYDVTGVRSRAHLVTTDTTATALGGLFQAANNDNVDAGVLMGFMAEAIGKSTANASTIATMRGGLIGTEWGAFDTITNLKTLHIRGHSRNAAGAGSFGTGYGVYIENEAVGGNGQAYDAGIYFKGTNLSAGNKAYTYGIDFSGGTYGTAEINLSNGETISNLTNGRIDLNGAVTAGDGGTTNYAKFAADGDLVFFGSAGLVYGEISVKDNIAATTLNSGAEVQLTVFDTNGPSNNTAPDQANNEITITTAGHYVVMVSIHVNNNAAQTHVIDVSLNKNNGSRVELVNIHSHRTLTGGSGDIGSMSLSGIADLAVNDELQLWATTDVAADRSVTFSDITLSIIQIGGT